MKRRGLLFLLILLSFGNIRGQGWRLNIEADLYNAQTYNTQHQSELHIQLFQNGSNVSVLRVFPQVKSHAWAYYDVVRSYNLNERITKFDVYTKVDKSNGKDPAQGWKKNIAFQSTTEKIKYKKVTYPSSTVYYTWEGSMTFYVSPTGISVNYLSQGSPMLPTADKVKIAATEGFDPETYKWVYSTDFITWKTLDNASLQGKTSIEINGQDVYGSDFESQMAAHNNTYIALEYNVYKDRNKPFAVERQWITLPNQISAPHIVSVETIPPACFGESSGKLRVKFDRALYPGETLRVGLDGNRFTENNSKLVTLDPVTFETEYFTGLAAGTYTIGLLGNYNNGSVTVATYTDGTEHSREANIPAPSALQLESLTKQDVHCNAGKDGKIFVRANGGGGEYDVVLKQDGNQLNSLRLTQGVTLTFDNLSAGTYSIVIYATNGCSQNNLGQEVGGNITVNEPANALNIVNWDFQEPTGFGLSDGTAQIRFSGGTAPYTIEWKNEYGNPVSPESLVTEGSSFVSKISNIGAGSFSVKVKDSNYDLADPFTEENNCGCAADVSFGVTEPSGISVSIEQQHYITCFGDNDGALVARGEGGRPFLSGLPYTYQWYEIEGSTATAIDGSDSIRTNLSYGQYKVKITDSNGISAESAPFLLNQPDKLNVTVQVLQNNNCSGDASGIVEASPSGGVPPYTYLWSTGEMTQQITGLPAGTYSVEVRDARFINLMERYCSATAGAAVTSPDGVTIKTLKQEPVHCYGGADGKIIVEAEGGLTEKYTAYLRQGNETIDSLAFTSTQAAVFENLSKGEYNVLVQDDNNCLMQGDNSSNRIAVTEPPEKVTIYDFSVTEPLGFGLSDGYAHVVFNGGTAPYTAEWKDETGRLVASNTVTEEDNHYISKAENLKTGVYFVTIQDANYSKAVPPTEENLCGCTDTIRFRMPEPPELEVMIEELHYVTCYGDNDGAIVAHAQGGRPLLEENLPYTYEWYKVNGQQTETITISDSIIQNLYSGYYKVKITDRNGIRLLSDAFFLEQPALLVVTTQVLQNTICSGDSIGIITATASGGTPPYSYFWTTNDTTPTIQHLPQGYYVVGVRDARYAENKLGHYCFAQAVDSILSPQSIRIHTQIQHPVCHGYANGEIVLEVTGGDPPYRYLWEDNSTSAIRKNLPEGIYTVRVTDFSGCFRQEIYELKEPQPVMVNLGKDFTLCKGQSLEVDGSIGLDGIHYIWTGASGTVLSNEPKLTISSPGLYRLSAVTGEGCSGFDEIRVEQSTDEVEPDFVIATQVANNTNVYAVDITQNVIDSISWIVPDNVLIMDETQGKIELWFPENGIYTIGMIAYKGLCKSILYRTVTVMDAKDIPKDTNEEPFLKRFVVTPNPNKGNFEALVELREPADYFLYLFDSNGKKIQEREIKNRQYEVTTFNLSGITTGIYYLRFVSKETASVFKIIIQ